MNGTKIPVANLSTRCIGTIDALEHVLVRIHTDEGLVGQAEAPPRSMIYGESVASVMFAIQDWFAPSLIGLAPTETERAFAVLDRVEHNSAAKACIDIALHDLIGQLAGIPLYQLFGGWCNSVELSYLMGIGEPDGTAEQAQAVVERYGIKTLKLKAGIDLKRDRDTLRAVRNAVGPDVRIYLDCNHAYPSLTALKAMKQWEEYDVAWVEEPCPVWDRAGRALIANGTSIPMMADESCKTIPAITAEIAYGHSRLVSIKTGGTGFTLSRKIMHLCEAHGIVPVSGSQSDSDFGAIAGAHFNAGHRILSQGPAELTSFLDAAGQLLAEPIVIKDGRFTVPEGPGLGVLIDEGKLNHFRLDL